MGQTSATIWAYCRKCDYALAGLPEKHRCPECGREFDLSDHRSIRRRPRRRWWRIARWVVYPVLLLALILGGCVGWCWWEWHQEQPVLAWVKAVRPRENATFHRSSLGPSWLIRRAGRWAYLLERVDNLQIDSKQPLNAQDLQLSRLRRLSTLELTGRGIGDDLMSEVGQMRELKSLLIFDSSVSDRGLARLSACRELERVYLVFARVGDGGLAPLAQHGELTVLDLGGSPVNDRCVPVLKGLAKLKILGLAGTKITPAGAAELKKGLPNASIIGPDGHEVEPSTRPSEL